ncbi:MAG: antibiotic biosynthesis monooxygenase [Alphaproteobacteria bacterium]
MSGPNARLLRTPWRSLGSPDPDGTYIALLTFLPLRRLSRVPWFLRHSRRIERQLRAAPGLIGYAFGSRPLAKRFWTLSVWRDEAALAAFVRAAPHADTMAAMTPHMGEAAFIRWPIEGNAVPPSWEEAFARWAAERGPEVPSG